MESVLETARAKVRARLAASLGLADLPEVQFGEEGMGPVATIARCCDALYRLEGGLTTGQWCVLRTLVCTLLDHLDENLDGDGLPPGLPLLRLPGKGGDL